MKLSQTITLLALSCLSFLASGELDENGDDLDRYGVLVMLDPALTSEIPCTEDDHSLLQTAADKTWSSSDRRRLHGCNSLCVGACRNTCAHLIGLPPTSFGPTPHNLCMLGCMMSGDERICGSGCRYHSHRNLHGEESPANEEDNQELYIVSSADPEAMQVKCENSKGHIKKALNETVSSGVLSDTCVTFIRDAQPAYQCVVIPEEDEEETSGAMSTSVSVTAWAGLMVGALAILAGNV